MDTVMNIGNPAGRCRYEAASYLTVPGLIRR
jgi:hypothetical protein